MIKKFYSRLYQYFGPQGWWPTTPRGKFTPVYRPQGTSSNKTPAQMFEICLGAILTQNTSWNNVVKVLEGLSRNNYLSLSSLNQLSKKKMEGYFRSSGYFRQKAHRVKIFISHLKKYHDMRIASFFGRSLNVVRADLLSLKGIGPETADSMLLYAGNFPVFVVDAYTKRIGTRWGILNGKESYDQIQKLFLQHGSWNAQKLGEYHALLVELAKKFCRPRPQCAFCPVRLMCKHGKTFKINKRK